MMQVTDEVRAAVDGVIRERLGGKVRQIDIEVGTSDTGEEVLLISIAMSRDTTANDFSGRFFGLTRQVRGALGDSMQGLFPIIRPIEAAEAHA